MRVAILALLVACGGARGAAPNPVVPSSEVRPVPEGGLEVYLMSCDLPGPWTITFGELRVDPPFSSEARFLSEDEHLCIEHPGSPVNGRLQASLSGELAEVRWWTQEMSDSLQRTQVAPLVPTRGNAVPPPPACLKALPPKTFSDRPISPVRDAWGYRCEAFDCHAMSCELLQGPGDTVVGSFELVRSQ